VLHVDFASFVADSDYGLNAEGRGVVLALFSNLPLISTSHSHLPSSSSTVSIAQLAPTKDLGDLD